MRQLIGKTVARNRAQVAGVKRLALSLMCLLMVIGDFHDQFSISNSIDDFANQAAQELATPTTTTTPTTAITTTTITRKLYKYKKQQESYHEHRTFQLFTWSSVILFADANPDANRLYEDLMMTYNRLLRPVQNTSDRMIVRLSLKLSQLIDVNLKNQMMTTNVWLNQEWSDYKLKWDPSEYGGIQDINVPAEQIWLPDIVLYNSAEGYFAVSIMTKAQVRYDGHVTWNPPAIFRSFCPIDITYFPFDSQNCSLKFGSWTFGASIDLRHINETVGTIEHGIDLSEYYQNVEWDIMQATARRNVITYNCCPNDLYPDVTFNILVRRKPLFYTINLILPCLVITALSFLVFYLPSDSGEKVTLTISILVSLIFFLSVLIETIPSTSLAMPLLGKYLVFTMILITLSVCATVYVLNIHFRTPSTHLMSPWVKRWCIDILPKYLFMNVPQYQNQQSNTTILPEQLVYLHNQAYGTHNGWPSAALLAALANHEKRQQQQQQQQQQHQQLNQQPYNPATTQVKTFSQLEPGSLESQATQGKLNASPSSLFLPYLQSEAARRLQMQRSRSSDRDQRSISDNQTSSGLANNNTNSSNNNCDNSKKTSTKKMSNPIAQTSQNSSNYSAAEAQSSANCHSKKQSKSRAQKSSKPFLLRLLSPSKSSNDRKAGEDSISSTNGSSNHHQQTHSARLQQESSSSFEHDYRHHNHFQARASVCSTNLWRIGPTRRCSIAVPSNYPSFYKPNIQANEISTISGFVGGGHFHHHHHHNRHHHQQQQDNSNDSGSSTSLAGPGAIGTLINAATSNLATTARTMNLAIPASSSHIQIATEMNNHYTNTHSNNNQRSLCQESTPGDLQLPANLPPPLPPDLPLTSPMNHHRGASSYAATSCQLMNQQQQQQEQQQQLRRQHMLTQMHMAQPAGFLLSSTSSNNQDQPNILTLGKLNNCPILSQSGAISGSNQYNPCLSRQPVNIAAQNTHNQHVNIDILPPNSRFSCRPTSGGQQQLAEHQSCTMNYQTRQQMVESLRDTAGIQYQTPSNQYMARSRSTDHRLCMYSRDQIYQLQAQQQQQQLQNSPMLYQDAHEQPIYSTNVCNTIQKPSFVIQNHHSIGRALGQAYVQRLQRQPTVSSIQSVTQRPSRSNIQRNAAYLIHPVDDHQQQPTNSFSMSTLNIIPRSKSQSSLDRRSTRLIGLSDCDECKTLHRAESRLRLGEIQNPYTNTNSRCLCNSTRAQPIYTQHAINNISCDCQLRRLEPNDIYSQQPLCAGKLQTCSGVQSQPAYHQNDSTQRRCDTSVKKACSCSSSSGNQINCKQIQQIRQPKTNLRPPPLTTLGLMKLISEVDRAIENAMFIAQHIDNLDEFESVKENWKYIAMVIDRIFLIIFFFASVVGTLAIFALVPWSYYTVDKPIDLQLTRLLALNLTGNEPYIKTCRDF